MATTWTQADIDALELALKNNPTLQSLTLPGGTVVQFAPLQDRYALLAKMRGQVAAAASTGGSTTRFASTSKGV